MEQPSDIQLPTRRKLNKRKLIFWLTVGGFILLAVLAIFIWNYYRSGKFNRYVATEIEAALKEYGVRAEVGGFEIGSGIRTATLRDLKFYNQQTGQLIATLERAKIELAIVDPFALQLRRTVIFKRLDLDGLELKVELDKTGKSNFDGLHQAPPRAPSRITFDFENLVGEIKNGKLHFNDQQHDLQAELPELRAVLQPLHDLSYPSVSAQLAAVNGRLNYTGRTIELGTIEFNGRLSEAGAEVKQALLRSQLGEITASGKIDDWQMLRYQLETQVQADLNEMAKFFAPKVKLDGAANFNGRLEGERGNYQLVGRVNSDSFSTADLRVRNAQINQIKVEPKDEQLFISGQQIQAQTVNGRDFIATAVSIPNVIATISTNNGKVNLNAAQASIRQVQADKFSAAAIGINLQNLKGEFSEQAINFSSQASVTAASFQKYAVANTSGNLAVNKQAISFQDFSTAIFGGKTKGNLLLNYVGGTSSLKANFTGLQTNQVVNTLAVNNVPLSGSVDGQADFTWPGFNLDPLSGKFNARFNGQTADTAEGAIPLTGDVAAQVQRGVFNFSQLQLNTDATNINATGSLALNGNSALNFSVSSTRAEQLLTIAKLLQPLQSTIDKYQPNLAGDFKFTGALNGSLSDPTINGDLNAAIVGLQKELLGSLSGQLLFTPSEIRFENAVLTASNGGTVKLNYAAPRAETATSGTLTASFERVNVDDAIKAANVSLKENLVAGELFGEAQLTGLPAAPQGKVSVNLQNGKIAGQVAELATANVIFDGKTARLDRVEARLPQGHLTANGTLDFETQIFQVNGQADQISLASLAEAFELTSTTLTGTADATFQVSGKTDNLDQLRVELAATSKQITINGRDAGELKLNARTNDGGRIDAELVTNITGQPQPFTASVELKQPGRPIQVATDLKNFDLTSLLAVIAPQAVDSVTGNVTGNLRISGPLFNAKDEVSLDRLQGNLTLNEISLNISGNPLKLTTPVIATLEGAQIRLQQTRMTGTGTDLRLGGTLGLREGAGLDFALNGTVNLSDFRIDPDVFTDGMIAIDARLNGTTSNPQLAGQATLQNISFSSLNAPVAIEEGSGKILLASDRITLENFTARANDGTLEIKGGVTLKGLSPGEWNFEATARDVSLLYAGARGTANGDLNLRGTPDSQLLSGTVNLPLVEYTTNFGVDGAFGSAGSSINFGGLGGDIVSSGTAAGGKSFFAPIGLNVRVEARDSLLVRNEQVNTVGSALLTIGGTLNEPDPRGRISFEGGTITFRKERYEINAGTIDLSGGSGSSPELNLLAEGDVNGYRVSIGFNGPIDNLEVVLNSEPQLARAEILSLITTGQTETGSLNSNDIVRSGVGTAASLLSQQFISKPLQGETEKLFGLNLFQIDPILRPNANPAARLTLGRQLARGFSFTYSTNLASEQDQTAILEYSLTSRFSAIASFTQGGSSRQQGTSDNDFSLEVRGRKRFALGADKDILKASEKRPAIVRPAIEARKLPAATVEVNKPDTIKISEKQLPELLPVMREGYSRALTRLGERNLINYLQEQGYFFAEVVSRCHPENCSGSDLRVSYDVTPGERYELSSLRLTGTTELAMGDLEGDLQSTKSSLLGSVPYLKTLPLIGGSARGITSNDRLRNDTEVIRRRMIDIGFRSARVEARRAINPDTGDLVIIFNVTEGDRSIVEEVNTQGNTVLTTLELTKIVAVKSGDTFSPTDIRDGASKIRQTYSERGYLEAKANINVTDLPDNRVRLVYEIEEGSRSEVQEIVVQGQKISREDSIRRFLNFKTGDILTAQNIRRTQRALYATGAFSEVDIRKIPISGASDAAQQVTVNITESKPLLLVYGLGYSTDEGPRGLAQLTNTNLFGRVNSATLKLRASRREQLAQLQYTDLRPFGSKWATTVSAFYNRNADLKSFVRKTVNNSNQTDAGRTFGINRFAAFLQTERKLNDFTSLRFRYNFEQSKLFNLENIPTLEVTRNERTLRLGSFAAGISRDTRDSAINPTKGQLFSADHSIAASVFGGNESFNKFFGSYQRYDKLPAGVPLLGNSIFAMSARLGLAAAFKVSDRDKDGVISEAERRLPISERFFSGGATTLRGFNYEAAGPQGILEPRNAQELPTLVPLGGDALTVFNFELRYPLTRKLQLVPFYDLGNVFRRTRDLNFKGMTSTVGLGFRFNTPIGPVGIDYGYLLDPPSFVTANGGVLRQKQGVIHIRFGQSF